MKHDDATIEERAGPIYERARRLANIAVWTVDLQKKRVEREEPGDKDFVLRKWSDLHFFVVALTRLRRAAILAKKIESIATDIDVAIASFDAALPNLKKMRDVAEHIDDYAVDTGKDMSISSTSLEVGSFGNEEWNWLGFRINLEDGLKAAVELFSSIQACESKIKKNTHPGS